MFPLLAKHLVDAVHAISAFQSTLAYIWRRRYTKNKQKQVCDPYALSCSSYEHCSPQALPLDAGSQDSEFRIRQAAWSILIKI